MGDEIKISGDTFTVDTDGHTTQGVWQLVVAENQFIALVPETLSEDRITQVMNDEYKDYEWGYYLSRIDKKYCIVVRGRSQAEFEAALNIM